MYHVKNKSIFVITIFTIDISVFNSINKILFQLYSSKSFLNICYTLNSFSFRLPTTYYTRFLESLF